MRIVLSAVLGQHLQHIAHVLDYFIQPKSSDMYYVTSKYWKLCHILHGPGAACIRVVDCLCMPSAEVILMQISPFYLFDKKGYLFTSIW